MDPFLMKLKEYGLEVQNAVYNKRVITDFKLEMQVFCARYKLFEDLEDLLVDQIDVKVADATLFKKAFKLAPKYDRLEAVFLTDMTIEPTENWQEVKLYPNSLNAEMLRKLKWAIKNDVKSFETRQKEYAFKKKFDSSGALAFLFRTQHELQYELMKDKEFLIELQRFHKELREIYTQMLPAAREQAKKSFEIISEMSERVRR